MRKAVITAAGRGTRMLPATRAVRKELLPLPGPGGRIQPAIQFLVEECIASGIEEVGIIVERGGSPEIARHFAPPTDDERRALAAKPDVLASLEHLGRLSERLRYIEQPSPEGLGHALFQARAFAAGEPIALLLGDHVFTAAPGTPPALAQAIAARKALGGSLTCVRHEPEETTAHTGVLRGEPLAGGLFAIQRLVEKPAKSQLADLTTPGIPDGYYLGHFGIHLFENEIFSCLDELISGNHRSGGEFQLTSAQQLLLLREARYHALLIHGERQDIGMPGEYRTTFAELSRLFTL